MLPCCLFIVFIVLIFSGADIRRLTLTVTALLRPALLNASAPWASTTEELQTLYHSKHTGAVTFQTCRLESSVPNSNVPQDTSLYIQHGSTKHATFNFKDTTLKLTPLADYLHIIKEIVIGPGSGLPFQKQRKPFIISVAGTPQEISQCFGLVDNFANRFYLDLLLEVELTSAPSLPSQESQTAESWPSLLASYLEALAPVNDWYSQYAKVQTRVGLKIPTFTDQFRLSDLVTTLLDHRIRVPFLDHYVSPLDFITVSAPDERAGSAPTQLLLGDIKSLRTVLDTHGVLEDIQIIAASGIRDAAGYSQMRGAGAAAVAIATASCNDALALCTEIHKSISTSQA